MFPPDLESDCEFMIKVCVLEQMEMDFRMKRVCKVNQWKAFLIDSLFDPLYIVEDLELT